METYDPDKAARVWQRVHNFGTPQTEYTSLPELIAEEWQDAAIYLNLSRRFPQKESRILRRLFEEERAHAACLKGIYTLISGQRGIPRREALPQEPVEATLRKCYGREMRCLAEYEARSEDPEYGQIFARLAVQEWEHCRMVLELLGGLKQE